MRPLDSRERVTRARTDIKNPSVPHETKVMDENWDYLIVLDACRYDFFSYVYGNYLKGNLKKVYSSASSTLGWCLKTFTEYYNDVIYVSTNAYINSARMLLHPQWFPGKKHFFKIVDVWDWGWDAKLRTVHPRTVNEVVQNLRDNYPSKRLIIHYLQPHAPYINQNSVKRFSELKKAQKGRVLATLKRNKTIRALWTHSRRILDLTAGNIGLFGCNVSWMIRELLSLSPENSMDAVRRKIGVNGLRCAYLNNLKFVLLYVAKLVETLNGSIVITADHGEYLGERNCYGHPGLKDDPILREVPWLIITKDEKRKVNEEKKHITRKIKLLKRSNLI